VSEVPHVFVSDVHLRYGDAPYLERFLSFLRAAPSLARAVVIHGDLFDFYVGPKQGARAFYRPLFDTVRSLVDGGVKVTLLHGNRDYLIGEDFRAAGATVTPDELDLSLGGKRVHVSHGDEMCVHDLSYQRAKKVLRAGPMVAFTKALPVSAAVAAAKLYRRWSARKARKAKAFRTNRLASILDGAQKLIDREPYDVVVAGHIHHFADTPLRGKAGPVRLLTTGAWDEWGEGPNYVQFDGREIVLKRFP
jgi:UDP-2,3-diacylglucosamine hydrolase